MKPFSCIAVACTFICSASASAQIHNENFKFLPNDGQVSAAFGFSIDADNGIIAVGSPYNGDGYSGSVYLFDQNTGQQLRKLTPDIPLSNGNFGVSVAIENNLIVVGSAHYHAPYGVGFAYIFDAQTGEQLAKLTPDTGDEPGSFGYAVDIEDGIIAVGSPRLGTGAVYLFDAATGTQLHRISDADNLIDLANFGQALDMDQGVLAIGAPNDGPAGSLLEGPGSAYLYNIATGTQIKKIWSSDGTPNNRFGSSVAIEGDRVIVGAPGGTAGDGNGHAYLFSFNNNDTQEMTKLHRDFDAGTYQYFSQSVSIENGKAAIGAMGSRLNGEVQYSNAGAVYLFDTVSGDKITRFVASDATRDDTLGRAVVVTGNTIYTGSIWDDDNGDNSGSAYAFSIQCDADLNNDSQINFLDVSAYLAAFSSQDPIADFEADGNFNFLDVSAFLAAFSAGCP